MINDAITAIFQIKLRKFGRLTKEHKEIKTFPYI